MPDFQYPELLYLLLAVPVVFLVFIFVRWRRRKLLRKFGDYELVKKHIKDYSPIKSYLKFILAMLGLSLIIISAANPRVGSKLREAKREGIDIILALDISKSMLAEDLKPNRLERAKHSIGRLIDNLETDRIGMIIFAGGANVLFPLTADYSAAKMFLSTLDPDYISEQGTAVSEAINIAAEKFHTNEKQKKALIIISDGEVHDEEAIEAAEKANEKGFIIHTVGVGSVEGAPIPIYSNGKITSYLKDDDGKTVISKLNETALKEIAEKAGGTFIRYSITDPNLKELIDKIDKMEKKQFEAKKFEQYDNKFQYFLAAGIIFLMIDLLISYKKLNLSAWFGFKEK